MKINWFFIFLAVTLTICMLDACSETLSQGDFYGAWLYEENDISDSKMEYTITATTLTTLFTDTSPFTPRRTVYEIFSWEKVTNNDMSTKNDYPAGFILGLRSSNTTATAQLLIHRNKMNLVEAGAPDDIYIKQLQRYEFGD
jgi:hypothetical protein